PDSNRQKAPVAVAGDYEHSLAEDRRGHEPLESTRIYTRVTINDLKQIHSQCHPSESLSDTKK
ncbi:MAG: hypothetical protein R6V39_09830, partial [Desulfovibrionales bacterium]